MRKSDAASSAASKVFQTASLPNQPGDAPVQLVCLAMVLAIVALGLRIATIW
jgi:hypothetical protein